MINTKEITPAQYALLQEMRKYFAAKRKTGVTRPDMYAFMSTKGQIWAPNFVSHNQAFKKYTKDGEIVRGFYDLWPVGVHAIKSIRAADELPDEPVSTKTSTKSKKQSIGAQLTAGETVTIDLTAPHLEVVMLTEEEGGGLIDAPVNPVVPEVPAAKAPKTAKKTATPKKVKVAAANQSTSVEEKEVVALDPSWTTEDQPIKL